MAFGRLPNELLENIIVHTLPEGFEGLALTSKHVYTLCAPFIEHHNKLRFHFRNFLYYKTDQVVKSGLHLVADTPAYTACSAFNLIALIEGDLDHDVDLLVAEEQSETWHFSQCCTAVGCFP